MPKKIGFDLHSSVEDDARTRFPHLNKREESGGDGKRLLGITWNGNIISQQQHMYAVPITRARGRMAMITCSFCLLIRGCWLVASEQSAEIFAALPPIKFLQHSTPRLACGMNPSIVCTAAGLAVLLQQSGRHYSIATGTRQKSFTTHYADSLMRVARVLKQ